MEDIRLKPRHKTIITAKIVDSDLKGVVVIEPALIISEKTGVLIARVLVDVPTSREVPIQLTNPADKTIVIYKDQTIGFVHHISEENEQVNQIHDNATEELVDNMISNAVGSDCSPEKQDTLTDLLRQFKDIISTGSHDLGKTSNIEHNIDTGDQPAVRSGLRRISFH